MADHSRRTTILLTVVAILFILTIIILCLPYDIGHKKHPSKDRVGSDRIYTTTHMQDTTSTTIITTPTTTPSITRKIHIDDTTTTTPSTTPSTTKKNYIHGTNTTTPSTSPSTTPNTASSTTRRTYIEDSSTTTPNSTTSTDSTDIASRNTSSTSSSSSTWSTSENVTEATTLRHTHFRDTFFTESNHSTTEDYANQSENVTEATTLDHTDPSDTYLTYNVTHTESNNYTTEYNVNQTSDLTTEDNLRSNESTTVVVTEPITATVSTSARTSTSTTLTSTASTSTTPASTTPMVTTIEPFLNETRCDKPECKDFAAKMWLQRDTSADPCEDFYQYSCGGVVDNPSLHPVDAGEAVKRKITDKLLGDDDSGPYKDARNFYLSCLHQDPVKAQEQWRDTSDWMDQQMPSFTTCDKDELTTMLAELIKNNFAPLFDVSLGLNDEKQFVPRVTPPILRNPFSDNIAQKYCLKEYKLGVLDKPNFDVEEKYEEYLNCMGRGLGMEVRLHHLKLNLKRIQIQDSLINKTIDFFRKASKLKRDPLTPEELMHQDYQPFPVDTLNIISGQIDWDKILFDVFNNTNSEGTQIQVYNLDYIMEINTLLSEEPVCDVLSTLWKESRYMDLVSPQSSLIPYSKEYCLDLTTSLLPELLYSVDETLLTTESSDKVFESIWTMQTTSGRYMGNPSKNQALQMFNQTQSSTNYLSIFENQPEIKPGPTFYQMSSLKLLQRFRSELSNQFFNNYLYDKNYYQSIYPAFENAAFHPENKCYSASSYLFEEPYYMEDEPAYLSYPSLGAALAKTAIRHDNQLAQDTGESCDMEEEFKGYEHSNITMKINKHKMEFARDFSKMVWDGYMRGKSLVADGEATHLEKRDFAPLPLMEDFSTEQLFYLRSAQIYCEKTSSLDILAVKERGHIPGPIRVNRILMNEPGFRRAFGCPKPQKGMCN